MAKCGIIRRYPVKAVPLADTGSSGEPIEIGTAESLGQAVALAERQGFAVRDNADGGQNRFVPDSAEDQGHFVVTIYPD
jgi:hypothetical protein